MMNERKRKKRVTSPDDWYPTADDGMVEVILIHDEKKAGWRVAVWGADDFGMELPGLDITTGFDMFRAVTDGVTKDVLRKRGFVDA